MLKKIISLLFIISIFFCLSACESGVVDKVGQEELITPPQKETMQATDENNIQETDENIQETDSPEDLEEKLSSSCDKILATGYDADNNYYEVVSNESEDYDGLKISVGVIKNNEWVLEPTTNMPFVTEENTFSENGPETGTVYYIGNGCFLSQKKHDYSYYKYIVYNAINGNSYSTSNNYEWRHSEIPIPTKLDDEYMIIGYIRYGKEAPITILNTNDMSTHEITVNGYLNSFSNISEGLFAVAIGNSNYPSYYFYDINGNEKLSLAQYKTRGNQSVNFIDQKCTIEVINDHDTEYKITIDKNGTVLSSEKVD